VRFRPTLTHLGILCCVLGVGLLVVGFDGWYVNHYGTGGGPACVEHGHYTPCDGRPNPRTWGPAGVAVFTAGVVLVVVARRRRVRRVRHHRR
jgi:hypothetical protein